MASEGVELLVLVPALPLDSTPNGVCTYARQLLNVLKGDSAIRFHLVAKSRAPGWQPAEREHAYYPPPRSLYNRVLMRVLGRAGHEKFMAWRFGAFLAARPAAAPRLIEMEEAFGQSLLVQRHAKVPVILRLHGPWFLVGASQGVAQDAEFHERVRREGQAIYAADAVSAPSAFVLDAVEKYYAKPLRHKAVLPNPFPQYSPQQQWLAGASDLVVFIGRFDRVKGADVFIEAMFLLAARRPGLRALFIGPDDGQISDADGVTLTRVQFVSRCEQRHIKASPIEFMGRKDPAQVLALRQRAAVCVVASRVEMFPYTVAEAMAQGVPTVASRVGGIPEMLHDGDNGLLFDSGDAPELANCVEQILQSPPLARSLSRNALRTVNEKYAPERLAAAYGNFYRQVADARF